MVAVGRRKKGGIRGESPSGGSRRPSCLDGTATLDSPAGTLECGLIQSSKRAVVVRSLSMCTSACVRFFFLFSSPSSQHISPSSSLGKRRDQDKSPEREREREKEWERLSEGNWSNICNLRSSVV